jgi:hypothetical protein
LKKFIRKKSGINNWGLFAGQNFKKGDKVIEYKGKKYTHKQIEEDDRFDNSKAIYLFTLNKKMFLMVTLSLIQQNILIIRVIQIVKLILLKEKFGL